MKKIDIVTLGCAKNRVDSEHIAQAIEKGYKIYFDREDFLNEEFEMDVVVINTCGFILDAKEESITAILEAIEAKQEGRIEKLYVIGCLSERYADELRGEMPDVDAYFGARDFSEIIELLDGENSVVGRKLTTPDHYAYLKISEGCNWGCGYCAIPLIRGKHRSVPMEELLEEAQWLADRGTRELIVIAQDSTYYGVDLYGQRKLGKLLKELCKIEGIDWIRVQYAYPTSFPRDVIEVMASEPKICKYLDIPFQHISNNVLSTMRRGITKQETLDLIAELRAAMPDIAIRTTMLVGYPTESEADFEELMQFVEEARFERLGVFAYSEEEDTYSALNFVDNIEQEVKEKRVERIMMLQETISEDISRGKEGLEIDVLFDRIEGDYLVGRSQWDSPEVDGEVLVLIDESLLADSDNYIGNFARVRVTGVELHDLYGEIID